jgi:hypothetical protein
MVCSFLRRGGAAPLIVRPGRPSVKPARDAHWRLGRSVPVAAALVAVSARQLELAHRAVSMVVRTAVARNVGAVARILAA